MSDPGAPRDPHWVHRSALHAVAAWILVCSFAFSFNSVWTYAQARKRAERDVKIVRESRVPWIRYKGHVYSQDQIVEILRRRPWWAALPYAVLAVLMGLCAIGSFWWPRASAVLALLLALGGGALQLARLRRLDVSTVGFFVFLWLLLGLGIRSAVGFVRVRRARRSEERDRQQDATEDSAAPA